MGNKLIKDSIHGYIEVEECFVETINTAIFQRLKRLQQTSYRVLYPSASHDRFVHSIGVYYLGRLAYDSIVKNTSSSIMSQGGDFRKTFEKWRIPFLTACLLHDIGHAPFSHTCEIFYDQDSLISSLKDTLSKQTNSDTIDSFTEDYEADPSAKQHEVMSALIAIKHDGLKIQNLLTKPEHFDFVARAIMGCVYRTAVSDGKDEREIKNALIRVINSSLIDVDKLDYILRDSVLSGYMNVEMDLPRLMSSFVLHRKRSEDTDIIWPMYKQSAQSVIENVFTARNNEYRWITAHNAVVYDTALLQSAIQRIAQKNNIKLNDIFCYEALVGDGVVVEFGSSTRKFKHLGDEDVLCLLKENFESVSEVEEYFDRNMRKRAIWKTHSEFVAHFGSDSNTALANFKFFIHPGDVLHPVSINTYDSMTSTLDETMKEKYTKFFKRIGFDFKDNNFNDEIVFIDYSADSFTRKFDADSIYLLYRGTYKTYNEVVGLLPPDKTTSRDMATKGFFVYYKPREKDIQGDKFLEQYKDQIANKKAEVSK